LVTELRPLKNANLSKFSERRLKLIVAIHQPQYLPWLGYFDKIIKADAFCYLDNVQYKKNEWQNRNRIKTAQGRQWLTVPVSYRFPAKINEVKINNTVNWKRKHLQAMITNYSKAPFFAEYIGFFEEVYSKDWELISELNVYLIGRMQEMLNIKEKRTVLASTLSLSDDPTERLIDICKTLEGDTYLSGQDGAKYMDLERFKANGIEVSVQDFIHPEYPQLFGDFASHLSIVDLLFNCGPETLERIKACKR
jgi:hypothetical protein